jgi:RNA polymerase sigma factor (sigma-70 family)
MRMQDKGDKLQTLLPQGDTPAASGRPWTTMLKESSGEEVDDDSDLDVEAWYSRESPQTDNLVAQYFADVRCYALLGRAEERALWSRIEHHKARVRRALCMSPVALAALARIWQQVQETNVSLKRLIRSPGEGGELPGNRRARFEVAMATLENLHTALQTLSARRPTSSPQARRLRRQRRVRLWRQWVATWEALQLHPDVYEAIRHALTAKLQADANDVAVIAAHAAWARCKRALDQAKLQMLRANLRLVIHVANGYRNQGVPFLDLIQEGNMGLMRALEKFEPHREVKFVTYAYWWVRQSVTRALGEQYRTIRLPAHIIERNHKLRTVRDTFWGEHGRAPQVPELSAALAWTPEEVEDLISAAQPMIPLEQPVVEGDLTLVDLLPDDHTVKPEELVAEAQLQQRLKAVLAHLPRREARVLRLRYGLSSKRPHTLEEIGNKLGLSRERVRQIEQQALKKLRQPQQRDLLAAFATVTVADVARS